MRKGESFLVCAFYPSTGFLGRDMRRPEFVMRLKTRRKIDTREKRLVSLHHSAILHFIRPANVNSLKPICLYDFNEILLTKSHNHAGTTFPLTYALFETIFCHFFSLEIYITYRQTATFTRRKRLSFMKFTTKFYILTHAIHREQSEISNVVGQ